MEISDGLYRTRNRIEHELRDIAEYLDFLHGMLWHEEDKDRKAWEERLEWLYEGDVPTDADVVHAYETYGEDPREPDIPYSPFRSTFTRATNYSYIMLVCLVFEGECQNLLHEIAKWKGVEPPVIRQNMVSQARNFIGATLGPRAVPDEPWTRLEKLMSVRNCIAHAGGSTELDPNPGRRTNLEDYAKSEPGLSVEEWLRHGEPMLVVEEEYCKSAISTVKAAFEGVFAAIDEMEVSSRP